MCSPAFNLLEVGQAKGLPFKQLLNSKSQLKQSQLRGQGIAESEKCLLHKFEDLSLTPQNFCKKARCGGAHRWSQSWRLGGAGRSLRLSGQPA